MYVYFCHTQNYGWFQRAQPRPPLPPLYRRLTAAPHAWPYSTKTAAFVDPGVLQLLTPADLTVWQTVVTTQPLYLNAQQRPVLISEGIAVGSGEWGVYYRKITGSLKRVTSPRLAVTSDLALLVGVFDILKESQRLEF